MHRWDSLLPMVTCKIPPLSRIYRREGVDKMSENIFNTLKISVVFCCLLIIVREILFFLCEILHTVHVK